MSQAKAITDFACPGCGQPTLSLEVSARLAGNAGQVEIKDDEILTFHHTWDEQAAQESGQEFLLVMLACKGKCKGGLEIDITELNGHPRPGKRLEEIIQQAGKDMERFRAQE